MRCQAVLGEQGWAIRHYEELMELLDEQLGHPRPSRPGRSTSACAPAKNPRATFQSPQHPAVSLFHAQARLLLVIRSLR
jgi:hypothetical protein